MLTLWSDFRIQYEFHCMYRMIKTNQKTKLNLPKWFSVMFSWISRLYMCLYSIEYTAKQQSLETSLCIRWCGVFQRIFYDWIYVGFSKICVINLSEVCGMALMPWEKGFLFTLYRFEFLFLFQWHPIYLYFFYFYFVHTLHRLHINRRFKHAIPIFLHELTILSVSFIPLAGLNYYAK